MIGIGTDLVDIDRFREVLTRTPGIRTRLFCDAELAYADTSGDPARPLPPGSQRRRRFSSR